MNPAKPSATEQQRQVYLQKVGSDEKRKLESRRQDPRTIWSGVAVFGLVGWTIALPTVLGTGFGLWLDRHHPGSSSWTLTFLVAGLTFGCFQAWRWMSNQEAEINTPEETEND